MSELKFSPNSFLEVAELNRLRKFLDTDGFRQFLIDNTNEFGLIRKENEVFSNGLVQEDTGLTVKINELFAIDSNGKLIHNPATTQIAVPADSNYYWIKVAYTTTTEETGTFSVDTFGNLTCTSADAELLTILRGQPNYPSRIYFTNAVNNILEYDCEEIIDDNNAVLTGSFTSESGLKLAVVGTFTPGYVPLTSEKFIFQYDYCTLTLVASNTAIAPAHTLGQEFFIARVKNDGVTLSIEDKRNEIWKTNSNYFLSNLELTGNPLIGVEQITYDDSLSTKVQNLLQIAWAFTATAFSTNLKLNKITINAGSGGIFKLPTFFSDFTDGDFDGWRLYVDSGNYYKITSSAQVASTIELILESLDGSDFFSDIASTVAISQNLIITPDAEEIEIICVADPASTNDIVEKRVVFPINNSYGRIPLNVYDATNTLFNIKYRYKHIKDYSAIILIPDDLVGFYNESQFDDDGVLIGLPTQSPYTAHSTNGFIPLQLNINAYSNFVDRIDLGDKLGVDVSALSNGVPVVQLVVGDDRQYQYFGDKDASVTNDQISLSGDMFINLSKLRVDGTACKNGNYFMLHFKQSVIGNGNVLRIVTDYINPTSYTELKGLTLDDEQFLLDSEEGLFFRCTFDGTDWIVNNVNESKFNIKDSQVANLYTTTFGGALDPGFNVNFATYPTFATIPGCTITTPNDGKTRRYSITFKANFSVSNAVNDARSDFRIVDLSTSTQYDYLELFERKATVGDFLYGSINLEALTDIPPNTTIEVQALGWATLGDTNFHDVKFIMIEI